MEVEGRSGVFVPMAADSARASDAPTRGARNASQRVRFVNVETGISDADYIEVTRGLSDGQHIVTTGAAALRDGDSVLIARPRGGSGATRAAPGPAANTSAPSGQQAQRAR